MTLGIIGTGLIGSSIGMRARSNGCLVLGYDADPAAAQEAQSLGAIDRSVARREILERAEIVVIAAHTRATIAQLEDLRRMPARAAALVMDVSSVKAPIVRAARGVRNFVATHPMAGGERSGPGAAAAGIFEGRSWFYVPTSDRELDRRAVEFIGSLGGVPLETGAEEHDRIVAVTSHVPQIVASLFASALSVEAGEAYFGPTAHELVRLSRSSGAMWNDIFQQNGSNIAASLSRLTFALRQVAEALERGDPIALERLNRPSAPARASERRRRERAVPSNTSR